MNNPLVQAALPPATPTTPFVPKEPLSPNGDNLAFLSPELSTFMEDLRAKVTAARSWHIAGSASCNTHPALFTPFSRLPQEIRARIYKLASYHPRVIEVTCLDRPLSMSPVPALFHTCSESRHIAMKVHEPLVLHSISTGTYVNWDFDTIFVNDRRADYGRELDYPEMHMKCKKLALSSFPHANFRFPDDYRKVESLIVVIKVAAGEGNIEFVPADCGEDALLLTKRECVRLWESEKIKSYMIRDIVRGPVRKMVPCEKRAAREQREKERKTMEPLISDEDFAIRLQYDLDHGL